MPPKKRNSQKETASSSATNLANQPGKTWNSMVTIGKAGVMKPVAAIELSEISPPSANLPPVAAPSSSSTVAVKQGLSQAASVSATATSTTAPVVSPISHVKIFTLTVKSKKTGQDENIELAWEEFPSEANSIYHILFSETPEIKDAAELRSLIAKRIKSNARTVSALKNNLEAYQAAIIANTPTRDRKFELIELQKFIKKPIIFIPNYAEANQVELKKSGKPIFVVNIRKDDNDPDHYIKLTTQNTEMAQEILAALQVFTPRGTRLELLTYLKQSGAKGSIAKSAAASQQAQPTPDTADNTAVTASVKVTDRAIPSGDIAFSSHSVVEGKKEQELLITAPTISHAAPIPPMSTSSVVTTLASNFNAHVVEAGIKLDYIPAVILRGNNPNEDILWIQLYYQTEDEAKVASQELYEKFTRFLGNHAPHVNRVMKTWQPYAENPTAPQWFIRIPCGPHPNKNIKGIPFSYNKIREKLQPSQQSQFPPLAEITMQTAYTLSSTPGYKPYWSKPLAQPYVSASSRPHIPRGSAAPQPTSASSPPIPSGYASSNSQMGSAGNAFGSSGYQGPAHRR